MKKWQKTGTAFALSLGLLSSVAPAVLAAESDAAPAIDQYVALGDSLTVGYQPGMTLSSTPYGFVDRVYEQALYHGRADLKNYGIAGLTSAGLKNLLEAAVAEKSVKGADIQPNLPDPRADQLVADTKKLKAELQAADLITITIGGNDFLDLPTLLLGKSEEEGQLIVAQRLEAYAENTGAVLKMIHELNPNAQVVIADQYNPVPELNASLYTQLQEMTRAFSQTLDAMVDAGNALMQMNLKAAHVAPLFVGNEITYTHITEQDIHPNQMGYNAMADQFAKTVWGEYKNPLDNNGAFTVIYKGVKLTSSLKPQVLNGVSYVPVRDYAQALGATVQWNGKTQTAQLARDGQTLSFKLGAKGTREVNSRLFVPIRVIAEGFGLDLRYIAPSNTVYLNE